MSTRIGPASGSVGGEEKMRLGLIISLSCGLVEPTSYVAGLKGSRGEWFVRTNGERGGLSCLKLHCGVGDIGGTSGDALSRPLNVPCHSTSFCLTLIAAPPIHPFYNSMPCGHAGSSMLMRRLSRRPPSSMLSKGCLHDWPH
jgi:hypothetical protein